MRKLTNPVNLHDYDHVLISSSAGKDSQTMLRQLVLLADEQNYPRTQLTVVHADLGRVEWTGTSVLCEQQTSYYGLRFLKVSRPQGDLLEHVEQRGKWPSNTARYCTSDHKRGQIAKLITQVHRELVAEGVAATRILSCIGLRAEESPARAKKVELTINKRASTKSRTVTDWLPILDWTEDEVWSDINANDIPHHRAYDLGMPRLSCVFCIFAPKPALVLAGKHNPELLEKYVALEKRIDHTFRLDCSMQDVADAVADDVEVEAMDGEWNM